MNQLKKYSYNNLSQNQILSDNGTDELKTRKEILANKKVNVKQVTYTTKEININDPQSINDKEIVYSKYFTRNSGLPQVEEKPDEEPQRLMQCANRECRTISNQEIKYYVSKDVKAIRFWLGMNTHFIGPFKPLEMECHENDNSTSTAIMNNMIGVIPPRCPSCNGLKFIDESDHYQNEALNEAKFYVSGAAEDVALHGASDCNETDELIGVGVKADEFTCHDPSAGDPFQGRNFRGRADHLHHMLGTNDIGEDVLNILGSQNDLDGKSHINKRKTDDFDSDIGTPIIQDPTKVAMYVFAKIHMSINPEHAKLYKSTMKRIDESVDGIKYTLSMNKNKSIRLEIFGSGEHEKYKPTPLQKNVLKQHRMTTWKEVDGKLQKVKKDIKLHPSLSYWELGNYLKTLNWLSSNGDTTGKDYEEYQQTMRMIDSGIHCKPRKIKDEKVIAGKIYESKTFPMFVDGDFEEITAPTRPIELEEIIEELSNPARKRESIYGKGLEVLVSCGMPMFEIKTKNKNKK